jgi:hypothetical protein
MTSDISPGSICIFSVFFSLTEHIGFALQAFPFALITASVLGLLFIYIRPVTGENKANRRKQSKIGLLIWVAWAVFACAFLLIFKTYAVAIGGLIGGMLIGFVVLVSNLIARVLLGCLAATVLTFAIGFGSAVDYIHPSVAVKYLGLPSTTIETKDHGSIDVRLIRSGDRGVLFFDEKSNKVTLLRWDEIKQISTVQAQ